MIFVVCTNASILYPLFSIDRTLGGDISIVCQKHQANHERASVLPFPKQGCHKIRQPD